MKILVVGASGQLGSELLKALSAKGGLPREYEDARVDALCRSELDISDAAAVNAWFDRSGSYDLVFNAAAQTNVDGCERAEGEAYLVNAHGPENLARAVARTGGKFIHVSTDYVFDGKAESAAAGRAEEAPVCPVSAYGRTKLAGEKLSMLACDRTFVVRTAWLYSATGKNFVKTMLRLAREKGVIRVVNDQVGNPTNAADLADGLLRLAVTEAYGIYHGVNSGACSWFDFACRIVADKGVPCEKFGISTEGYKAMFPMAADRPRDSRLDNARLSRVIGRPIRSWQEAIDDLLATSDL